MFAALPMYDRPALRAAHDALWGLIRDRLRARGIDAPDRLDRATDPMQGWARPDLVLGQICNLPYRARFADRLTRIGAADYGLDGCPPGFYRSIWIVRQDDPAQGLHDCAGYRFAFNEGLSQSGWGAPISDAQAAGVALVPALRTGAHVASLAAVAEGRADIAAIDAQTLRLLQRDDPAVARVRGIGATSASPGMTFVTASGRDAGLHFDAIASAIAALDPSARKELGLRGIVALPAAAYDLPLPPTPPQPLCDLPV